MKKIKKVKGLSFLLFFILLFSFGIILSAKADISFPNPLHFSSFRELIDNLTNYIFIIGIILVPLFYILAGGYFITAAGDPQKVATAKKIILYTTIGLIIILLGKGLPYIISNVFTGNTANTTNTTCQSASGSCTASPDCCSGLVCNTHAPRICMAPSCDQLYNIHLQSFGTMCGNANYNKKADMDKDGRVNSSDFGLFADNYETSGWCQQMLNDPTYPCPCGQLFDLMQSKFTTACGDANYDKRVDVTKDGVIDMGDVSLYGIKYETSGWCQQMLNDLTEPCPCQLHNLIFNHYSTACGNANYDKIADINNDKAVNEADYSMLWSYNDNQTWCQQMLDKLIDPCTASTECNELFNLIVDHYQTACEDENYDKIADVNKDGVVGDLDFFAIVAKYNDQSWCLGRTNNLSDPCP